MSRKIQECGQFFVEQVGEPEHESPVPVDNFVFYTFDKSRTLDGYSVRLSGVGSRVVVAWGNKRIKFEWFDTYAEGLRKMADILERKK